jgi:hypothetical protein
MEGTKFVFDHFLFDNRGIGTSIGRISKRNTFIIYIVLHTSDKFDLKIGIEKQKLNTSCRLHMF